MKLSQIKISFFVIIVSVFLFGMDSRSDKPSAAENNMACKIFIGSINNQYQIKMKLYQNGLEIIGSYFYEKYKKDIPLKGKIDKEGDFVLNEYGNNKFISSNSVITGVFEGKFTDGKNIEGTWSKINGKNIMPFCLSETRKLIPLEEAKIEILNPADYGFVKKLCDEYISGLDEFYTIDLNLPKGLLYIGEYNEQHAGHFTRLFFGFVKEENYAYRIILHNAYVNYKIDYRHTKENKRYKYYIDDADGDGVKEILQFEIVNKRKLLLRNAFDYDERYGFFETGGQFEYREVTLEDYINERAKGPLVLKCGSSSPGRSDWRITSSGLIESLPACAIKIEDGLWDISSQYQTSPDPATDSLQYLKATCDKRNITSKDKNIYTLKAKINKKGCYEFGFEMQNNGRFEKYRNIVLIVQESSGEGGNPVIISPEEEYLAVYDNDTIRGTVNDIITTTWTESKNYNMHVGKGWKFNRCKYDDLSATTVGTPVISDCKKCFGKMDIWAEGEADKYIKSSDKMYFYDNEKKGFYFKDAGYVKKLEWSHDSKRLFVILEYPSISENSLYHSCVTRQNIPFLNYLSKFQACAILIVDTEALTITPLVLPFTLPRLIDFSWWDKNSIVMPGKVVDGILKWDMEVGKGGLTIININDKSQKYLPFSLKQTECAFEYSIGVRRHQGLGIVSICYEHPGPLGWVGGVAFFDDNMTFIKESNILGGIGHAVEMPKGYLIPGEGYYIFEKDVIESYPDSNNIYNCLSDCAVSPEGRTAELRKTNRRKNSGDGVWQCYDAYLTIDH